MSDLLADTLAKWSWHNPYPWGNAASPGTLDFKRGPEVIALMRGWNSAIGAPLSDAEMARGIDGFSGDQYRYYGSGYAVDSDPFNIARWSVAYALRDKGMQDAADKLIASTDAKQKLTAQEAIDIGKAASAQYTLDVQNRNVIAALVGRRADGTLGPTDMGGGSAFGDLLKFAAPLALGAVIGPAVLGELGGASALGADALTVAGDFGSSEILAAATAAPAAATAAPAIIAGDFGSSEILAAATAAPAAATAAPAIIAGDFGSSEILAGNPVFNVRTIMFDDFGDIINADGSLTPSTGSWNLTDAEIQFAADQSIAAGTPLSGLPTTYASAPNALNDIFGNIGQSLKNAGTAFSRLTSAVARSTPNNKAQPNATNRLASADLTFPMLAVGAYLALR